MPEAEIAVLGPIEVHVDGRSAPLPGRRPAALLALLALAGGRPVSIDELARGVWDDDLPVRLKGTLQTYVGRLRKVLGDAAVVTDPAGYRLGVPPVVVDLDRFTTLVSAAEDDPGRAGVLLDEALGLWRGDPLGGLSDWIERHERPALIERYLAAVERRADLWIEGGDPAAAVQRLRPLVDQHPFRETLWERLLVALRDAGRSAEALERYEAMRTGLADELGADPSAALQDLHRDLLTGSGDATGSGPAAPAVPHQLPWVVSRFVGRERQLARLDRLVDPVRTDTQGGHVIAIHGAGGAGKSTLAVHWATETALTFPDGELFVRLSGYGPGEPVSPAAALETMLRSIGVAGSDIPTDVDGRGDLLRTRMAGRRMLVVLDDAHDADQVRPLLPGGPSLVLVTSRSQLRGLAAREGVARVAVEPMSEEESVALLSSRLDDADLGDGADLAGLAELAGLCGHLPVAMVVAAERAGRGDLGLDDLAALLRDRRSRLATLSRGEDATMDVGAIFEWSYQALTPLAATLYRRLGALADTGFSLPVATALLGAAGGDAERALDQLVERHLVTVAEPGWYVVHDLVREHAHGLGSGVDDGADLAATTVRLREWYVHSAFAAERTGRDSTVLEPEPAPPGVEPQRFADQRAALAWFDRHRRSIETILAQAAASGDHHVLSRLAITTAWYYGRIGAWSETALLTEIALDGARRAGDDLAVAILLNRRGTGHGRQGRYEDAREAFRQARELFVGVGNVAGEYRMVCNLAQAHLGDGDAEPAIALLEDARTVTVTFDDESEHLAILSVLVYAYIAAGRIDDAAGLADQVAARWRALGDVDGEATILDVIGSIAVERGRLDEAEVAYQAAADLYEAIGDQYERAWTLAELGRAQADAGLAAQATVNLRAALTIMDRVGASDTKDLNREALEATLATLSSAEAASTT